MFSQQAESCLTLASIPALLRQFLTTFVSSFFVISILFRQLWNHNMRNCDTIYKPRTLVLFCSYDLAGGKHIYAIRIADRTLLCNQPEPKSHFDRHCYFCNEHGIIWDCSNVSFGIHFNFPFGFCYLNYAYNVCNFYAKTIYFTTGNNKYM